MSNKFCPMPFGSMHIDPDGNILVCCSDAGQNLDSKGQKFNVQTHSLLEAWNSDHYKTLRKKFLQGEQPASCHQCWTTELNDSSVSTRKSSVGRFQVFQKQGLDFASSTRQAEENQGRIDNHPVDFQLMSGNLCNLACKMCYPRYSNTWSKFYKKKNLTIKDTKLHSLMGHPEDIYMSFGRNYNWPKTHTMTKIFSEIKDSVYHINLTGGEPTLLEENILFLEELKYSKNIDNLEIQIITNTTNINKRLLDCVKPFKKVIVTSSIDGMDEIAYIQRTPSNWTMIYSNYQKLHKFWQENTNITYCINTTVTALNIHHIHKLWNFLVDKSECKIPVHLINLNIVVSKTQSTGLEIVPRKVIEKIKQQFQDTVSIRDSRVYNSMMNYFDTIEWADTNVPMLELLDSIQKLHPELDIKNIYQIYYE